MWPKIISTHYLKILANKQPKRNLKVLEHVGMELLEGAGLKVAKFAAAKSIDEIPQIYKMLSSQLSTNEFVIKAQVMTGGRGKGSFDSGLKGGVHLIKSVEEAQNIAKNMIGHRIFTKQTGTTGQLCNKVMLAERRYPKKEYYFAIVLDTTSASPILIGSSEGGVNIEELARDHPEKLHKLIVDIETGLTREDSIKMAKNMKFNSIKIIEDAADSIEKLYKVFMQNDCTLLEINPLTVDKTDEVLCMDCKVQVDDNARHRHKKLFAERDKGSENPLDVRAEEAGVNYIQLTGNIGCLVNGAGLAMATMDLIKIHGGDPANFLDVGGGATADQIAEAFRIINTDKNVRVILVNIFGGILRCDTIANGIVTAANELGAKVPVVVRLQGTRLNEAKSILDSSKIKVLAIDDLDQAAIKAVSLSK